MNTRISGAYLNPSACLLLLPHPPASCTWGFSLSSWTQVALPVWQASLPWPPWLGPFPLHVPFYSPHLGGSQSCPSSLLLGPLSPVRSAQSIFLSEQRPSSWPPAASLPEVLVHDSIWHSRNSTIWSWPTFLGLPGVRPLPNLHQMTSLPFPRHILYFPVPRPLHQAPSQNALLLFLPSLILPILKAQIPPSQRIPL